MSMFPYQRQLPHYYGDITRLLFIVVGVIMLFGLPTMESALQLPVFIPVIAIVILAFAAGYTSPRYRSSLVLNIWVSSAGLASFIYVSLFLRSHFLGSGWLFLNQVIAVLFLVSLYLSIKSLRGYSGS